ncbi:metal-sensitive transcriptional regulator [Bythopirellula goksoeyrii]|uniref:Copper-sensing transcriptional repressor CsoR n=1 Tax=Bythopirellula goksoeyrii TaxID=1400387 RepID=A0A5B9Q9T4_9BACT|nr:metal-sensitive transcriptional regulator [Bythopirellula goksoeyrii]QEG35814.1 Copper-sensing transcriptional repressor CsoR [Bythopirellula goksoeyrii]
MLSKIEKSRLSNRLRRVAGQVSAIERMIDEDAYCVDILTQIAAASGALDKVGQIILEDHVKTCLGDVVRTDTSKKHKQEIDELIKIFQKYTRIVD